MANAKSGITKQRQKKVKVDKQRWKKRTIKKPQKWRAPKKQRKKQHKLEKKE